MGAVIMMDVYLIPKLNLKPDYAEAFNKSFSIPAAIAWVVTLAISVVINQTMGVEVFFLGFPGWFIASALYVLSSYIIQKNSGSERRAA